MLLRLTSISLRVLTGVALTNADSLREALKILHVGFGVPHVVVSSVPLSEPFKASGKVPPFPPGQFDADEDLLLCACSSRTTDGEAQGNLSEVYAFGIAQIPGYFSGVGDLFSALVLAHFGGEGGLRRATGLAVGTVQAILRDTAAHSAPTDGTDSELDSADAERRVRRMRTRELRVIQNAGVIGSRAEEAEGWLWADFWT